MAISGDYAQPVQVNGYSCKNCTDVDYAKKHIDPTRPKDGPYGVNAKDNPTSRPSANVLFGGRLTGRADVPLKDGFGRSASGQQVDLFA